MPIDILQSKGNELQDKRILFCITGSVAAMESPRIIRELIKHGADIVPVLNDNAISLISPMLLEWASGNVPITSLSGKMEHVQLANGKKDSADLILIAPCTANTIGKIANGICDDVITTICCVGLGSDIPVVVVPGMHEPMYLNPMVQNNLVKLKSMNISIIDPVVMENKAKMANSDSILSATIAKLFKQDLHGKNILVTAGPTVENIDPVRIITNNSSGKMGLLIASEAHRRGANVTLIYGPGNQSVPNNIRTLRIQTSAELFNVTQQELTSNNFDLYIAAAAPTDFKVINSSQEKISSRTLDSLKLELVPYPKTIDMVKAICPDTKLIVFKAIYDVNKTDTAKNINDLFVTSKADIVIVNDVSRENSGFQSDFNEVAIHSKSKSFSISHTSKSNIAQAIINSSVELFNSEN